MLHTSPQKDHPDYHIRAARIEEIDAIITIFDEEVKAGRMLPRNPVEMQENIGSWIVAEENAEIIGCVSLVFFNQNLCEVRSLAVAPRYQGNGLGSKLIAAAITHAEEKEMSHVLTLTRATGVFKRLGFEVDSVYHFPEKVWKDCTPCPLRERCDEVALLYTINK